MEQNDWMWIMQLLGRLHPMVVHFPIGLLVAALLFEGFTIGGRRPGLREGISWMVYLGAFFAITSSLFGWLLRTYDDYSGELVQSHQTLGFITSFCSLVTAALLYLKENNKLSTYLIYRLSLLFTVISLTITGHLGATLTHGDGFLTEVLPWKNPNARSEKASTLLIEFDQKDSFSVQQLDKLNLEVRAIFAHNCYQCHGENKQKGDLVLDNKRGVLKGGKSGKVITAGQPENSELVKRISLPSDHDDVMPKKGKVLKNSEIELIKLWIKTGAHWADQSPAVFPEAPLSLVKPDISKEISGFDHPIDRIVDAYFTKENLEWSELVDDHTFIRRAYLDVLGLIPTPNEIEDFINDQRINKRGLLIDTLLNDNHNYTQHWISFWNDLLRNDYSGTGFITGGRKQITDWLYHSLMENKPYHQMVKELVNPSKESEGFIKGIQWRGVVNSSQRTEMQAAQNIGQSLLGVNVKCASCHNSFVSNLTLNQAYSFAAIFAESPLELNRCDKPLGKIAEPAFLYPELGDVTGTTVKERLELFADLLIKPDNGRLYRTITNRIWKQLLGRGIIEPVDEMDNAPWNSTLLDWLAADFRDSGCDLKQLIKIIMTSKAYQLPTVEFKEIAVIKSEKYRFNGPIIRRLTAEQMTDAISQIIAPVYVATAYSPIEEKISFNRFWHREIKFDRDVLPDPGTRYYRYVFSLPNQKVEKSEVLISVDHTFTLYINGEKISQGSDWRKVVATEVSSHLQYGDNVIAIEASNEGKIPNPAGILFAMKIDFGTGDDLLIQAGNSWKSTHIKPNQQWMKLEYDDEEWKPVRNYGSKHWDRLVNFSFSERSKTYARASLVRQHPFMKVLGRPSRENVSTSREEQATLLQALELTNGTFLNQILSEGAQNWLELHGNNTETLHTTLYQKSLGRNPTKHERKIIQKNLGESLDQESLQDLFWTTILLPEFQFIH